MPRLPRPKTSRRSSPLRTNGRTSLWIQHKYRKQSQVAPESPIPRDTTMGTSGTWQEDLAMGESLATSHTPVGLHPAPPGDELATEVSIKQNVVMTEAIITAPLGSPTKGEGSALEDTVDEGSVDGVVHGLSVMEMSATTSKRCESILASHSLTVVEATHTTDATPKRKSAHSKERTAIVAQAKDKAPTTTPPTKKAKVPVKRQKLPKRQTANALGATRGRMAQRGRGRGTSQRSFTTSSPCSKSRSRPLGESSIETSTDSGSVPAAMQETSLAVKPAGEEQGKQASHLRRKGQLPLQVRERERRTMARRRKCLKPNGGNSSTTSWMNSLEFSILTGI